MSGPYFVVEGDDHEQRVVEAASEEDAIEVAQADFEAQYEAEYPADLIVVLGDFESEGEALAAYPSAETS